MKFIGIIPARYASTRFPGKPLAMLDGKPVIQHVYEKVASCLEAAYVATDDERIFNAVEAFGGKAVMTRKVHKSGTDRIEEAIEKIGGDWDVIVNVHGHLCLPQRSFKRGNQTATKLTRNSREPGTTSMAAEWLQDKSWYDRCRNCRHRHARRFAAGRRLFEKQKVIRNIIYF